MKFIYFLKGTCECAVCSEKVPIKKWKDHAMNKHYNIAWKVGGCPIVSILFKYIDG